MQEKMKKQIKKNGKSRKKIKQEKKQAERERKNTESISCSNFHTVSKSSWDMQREVAVGEQRVTAA